jgi:hypothetical protein
MLKVAILFAWEVIDLVKEEHWAIVDKVASSKTSNVDETAHHIKTNNEHKETINSFKGKLIANPIILISNPTSGFVERCVRNYNLQTNIIMSTIGFCKKIFCHVFL